MKLSKRPKLKWSVSPYSGELILHSGELIVNNEYRIYVRLKTKFYEDSAYGNISVDKGHYGEDGEWYIDQRYFIGDISGPYRYKLSLREAKSIANHECRKIYKNILKNSFTK